MPFPAARASDMTQHGGVIVPPCSINTMIEMLPAARVTDLHVCPAVTVLVPHVGGPIVTGAPTILINFLPAARVMSLCVCVGPPSMVTKGAQKTILGDGGGGGGGGSLIITIPAPPGAPSSPPASGSGSSVGHPVDVASGRMFTFEQDWQTPCAFRFPFMRFYSSTTITESNGFGYGWNHTLSGRIELGETFTLFRDWEGRTIYFPLFTPDDTFFYHMDERILLRKIPQGYLLEEPLAGTSMLYQQQPGFPHFRPVCLRDGVGRSLLIAYDGVLPRCVTDALGNQWLLNSKDGRNIDTVLFRAVGGTDTRPILRYQYDSAGNLLFAEDAAAQSARYQYDHLHRMTQQTNRANFSYFFQYDHRSRCTRNWSQDGSLDLALIYSDKEPITLVRNGQGYLTKFEFDPLGMVTRREDPGGAALTFAYQGTRQIRRTDPQGRTIEFGLDPFGRVVGKKMPSGTEFHAAYGPTGSAEFIDPTGNKLIRSRQGSEILFNTQDAPAPLCRAVWDPRARRIVVRDALGNLSFLFHDTADRIVTFIDPLDHVCRCEYDTRGRRITITDARGALVRFHYDALGRMVAAARDGGGVFRYEYDPDGSLTHYVNGVGRVFHFQYDGAGRLVAHADPSGVAVKIRYDALGRPHKIVRPSGGEVSIDYDLSGRLQRLHAPDGRFDSFVYDPGGQMARRQEPSGAGIDYAYNDDGAVASVRYPDGVSVRYAYDPAGRLISASVEESELTFAYDGMGRLVEETQDGAVVSYGYDELGRLAAITTPAGEEIRYRYDAIGRLTLVIDWDRQEHRLSYRDENGLAQTRVLPNGLTETHLFSRFGLLQNSEVRVGGDGRSRAVRHYHHDDDDHLVEVLDSAIGRTAYLYGPAGRLEEAARDDDWGRETFVYDGNGNLLTAGRAGGLTYDNCDRILSAGGARCLHDPGGNLSAIDAGEQGVTRFTYDARHLLIRAELSDGTTVRYTYDALGRRTTKSCRGIETRYLWAGETLLAEEVSGRREEIRWYLFEPMGARPLSVRIDGRCYQYHNDHRGAPVRLSDAKGDFVWIADSAAYGEARTRVADVIQPLRLPGHYHDEETGLHSLRGRSYHPLWGRFTTTAPQGYERGLNLYTFAQGDPINLEHDAETWPHATGLHSGDRTNAALLLTLPGRDTSLPTLPRPGPHAMPGPIEPGLPAPGDMLPRIVSIRQTQPQEVTLPVTPALFAPSPSIVPVDAPSLSVGSGVPPFASLSQVQPCFPPGALVQTPEGPREIERLQPGDMVFACELPSGRVTHCPIQVVQRNTSRRLVSLGTAHETLVATPNHPFWVSECHGWQAASDIEPGMHLVTRENGMVEVCSVEAFETETATYNLDIASAHTYYVGNIGCLVHNGAPNGRPSRYARRDRKHVRIYEIIDIRTDQALLVGQTQSTGGGDLQRRFRQHLAFQLARHPDREERFLRLRVIAEGSWTPFEAAVWEQHCLARRAAEGPLANSIQAISPHRYLEYQVGYAQAPCA